MPTKSVPAPTVHTITRFRGLNNYLSGPALPPEFAHDILNVLVNNSGGLSKLRVPSAISSAVTDLGAAIVGRCNGYYDFQKADGTRQTIACWGTSWYKYEWNAAFTALVATVIDTDANNDAQWSFVQANYTLYMANGLRMLKWDGDRLSKWGITRPTAPILYSPSNAGDVDTFARSGGVVTIVLVANSGLAIDDPMTFTLCPDASFNVTLPIKTYDQATKTVTLDQAGADVAPTPGAGMKWAVNGTPSGTIPLNIDTPRYWAPTWIAPPGTWVYTVHGHAYEFVETYGAYDIYRPYTANPEWRAYLPEWKAADGTGSGTGSWTTLKALPPGYAPSNPHLQYDAYPCSDTIASTPIVNPTTWRKYKIAFKNSITGHESAMSPEVTLFPGVGTVSLVYLGWDAFNMSVVENDTQIDKVVVYSTLDGGSVYYFNKEYDIVRPIGSWPDLFDRTPDSLLDTSRRGADYNFPPPLAHYVCEWGGRIYIACLEDGNGRADIMYSGVEAVNIGVCEESFPPRNRLRLAIGADDVRGIGAIQAGLIAFSKSNEMFMFRGIPEDVTGETFLQYSAYLEKLPWQTALMSHATLEPTDHGLMFISAQHSVSSYIGSGKPEDYSLAVAPYMRDITRGSEQSAVSAYYNYADRDWYLVGIPYNGSTKPSLILVVDLTEGEDNQGTFVLSIGEFDWIDYIEDPVSGAPMVVIAKDNVLSKLSLVNMTTHGAQAVLGAPDAGHPLSAYWESGSFGSDSPGLVKTFRRADVISDRDTWSMTAKVIDDSGSRTWENPETVTMAKQGNRVAVNRKGRHCRLRLTFPEPDQDMNVTQVRLRMVATSTR